MNRAASIWTSGASTPLRSGPAALRPARRGKNPEDEPEHHALGRSRGGFGTKLYLVVDSHGIPLSAVVSPGQRHESKFVEPALRAVRLVRPGPQGGRPRAKPRRLAGDKGYSYRSVRRYLRRCGIRAVIPTRKDQRANPRFDKLTYRRRDIIERLIGWLKENRRLATRFEKLPVNFLDMANLAMFQRCLRLLHSSDRPNAISPVIFPPVWQIRTHPINGSDAIACFLSVAENPGPA